MSDIKALEEMNDMDYLIDAAGYGIDYWCSRAVVGKGTYDVTEDDSGEVFHLTHAKIRQALKDVALGKAKVNDTFQMAAIMAVRDEEEAVDSELADIVIQFACFGEVVYG